MAPHQRLRLPHRVGVAGALLTLAGPLGTSQAFGECQAGVEYSSGFLVAHVYTVSSLTTYRAVCLYQTTTRQVGAGQSDIIRGRQ